jgi:hypothetical protein
MAPTPQYRRSKGFQQTGNLVQKQIRHVGEGRGFAVSRLLTHWAEVVGPDLAQASRPVKVHYGRKGFGATLTVLTTGANAPMMSMQTEQIKQRVNACYGYAAISRVKITQTAREGFAEGRAQFELRPSAPKGPKPETIQAAQSMADGVQDPGLRAALAQLGANVITKSKD